MVAGGYITDRRCPGTPEHGVVMDMRDGGHYCPHHDHDFPVLTKNFWRDDEFEVAKSATSLEPIVTQRKIAVKPKRGVAKGVKR